MSVKTVWGHEDYCENIGFSIEEIGFEQSDMICPMF